MAKNWTMAEATVAIAKNRTEDIMDIGKRFPLVHGLVARALAGDSTAVLELLTKTPDYLTCNKMQTALKGAIEENTDEESDGEDEEEDEAPAKPVKKTEEKKPVVKAEKKEESGSGTADFEAMTAQQLYDFGKKNGIKFKSTKKADMLEVLKEQFGGKKKSSKPAVKEEPEDEEWEDDEDGAEEVDYTAMSEKELFKLCKERGIKAEIKKPAKYYIGLLKKADEAEAEEEEGWEDEEEEVEEPATKKPAAKKEEKKPASKPAAKPAKKDDDEDWDI